MALSCCLRTCGNTPAGRSRGACGYTPAGRVGSRCSYGYTPAGTPATARATHSAAATRRSIFRPPMYPVIGRSSNWRSRMGRDPHSNQDDPVGGNHELLLLFRLLQIVEDRACGPYNLVPVVGGRGGQRLRTVRRPQTRTASTGATSDHSVRRRPLQHQASSTRFQRSRSGSRGWCDGKCRSRVRATVRGTPK